MHFLRRMLGKAVFACRGTLAQRAAQRLIGGPRDTHILLRGNSFRCSTTHKYYWLAEHYEENLRRSIERHITTDSVFYDVGAHFGFWESMLAGKCAHIVAIEPSPTNFRRLVENVSGLANVTPLNVAASDGEGTLAFSEDGSMSHAGDGPLVVNAATLDSIAERNGWPTIIKIDIEGFGGRALAGMSEIIRTARPTIIAEIHDVREANAFWSLPGYLAETSPQRIYPYHVTFSPTP